MGAEEERREGCEGSNKAKRKKDIPRTHTHTQVNKPRTHVCDDHDVFASDLDPGLQQRLPLGDIHAEALARRAAHCARVQACVWMCVGGTRCVWMCVGACGCVCARVCGCARGCT